MLRHIWKCSNEILPGVDLWIPGRINDESLVFGSIIVVDAFHLMVVPIV